MYYTTLKYVNNYLKLNFTLFVIHHVLQISSHTKRVIQVFSDKTEKSNKTLFMLIGILIMIL